MSGLTILAWKNRSTHGAKVYAVWMFIGALWAWISTFLHSTQSIPTAEFLGEYARYTITPFIGVVFLMFCIEYTGQRLWVLPGKIFLYLFIPIITTMLNFSRAQHQFFIFDVKYELVEGLITRTAWSTGPWFWVHIIYSFGTMFAGLAILIRRIIKTGYPYRQQASLLFMGTLIGIIVYLPNAIGLTPPEINLAPIGFVVLSLVYAWVLFKYQLLDLMPIASEVLFDGMKDIAIVLDRSSRIIDLNPAAEKALGSKKDKIIGKLIIDVLKDEEREIAQQFANLQEAQAEVSVGGRMYDIELSPLFNKQEHYVGQLVMLRDITDRSQLINKLGESEERFRQLAEHSKDIIWIWDNNRNLEYVSPAFEYFTGTKPDKIYRNSFLVLKIVHPDDRASFGQKLEDVLEGKVEWVVNRVLHKDGTVFYLSGWGAPIHNEQGEVIRYIGIWRDVTADVLLNQKLDQLAFTDSLTQIYNRRFFFETARKHIEQAKRKNNPTSIVLFDIDQYKKVNDAHGHIIGDQILIHLADLCKEILRSEDVFARYGGDEFVVLLPDTTNESAMNLAERIRTKVSENPLLLDNCKVSITISMGVSTMPKNNALSIHMLLNRADEALYCSKKSGRNSVTLWKTPSNNPTKV